MSLGVDLEEIDRAVWTMLADDIGERACADLDALEVMTGAPYPSLLRARGFFYEKGERPENPREEYLELFWGGSHQLYKTGPQGGAPLLRAERK